MQSTGLRTVVLYPVAPRMRRIIYLPPATIGDDSAGAARPSEHVARGVALERRGVLRDDLHLVLSVLLLGRDRAVRAVRTGIISWPVTKCFIPVNSAKHRPQHDVTAPMFIDPARHPCLVEGLIGDLGAGVELLKARRLLVKGAGTKGKVFHRNAEERLTGSLSGCRIPRSSGSVSLLPSLRGGTLVARGRLLNSPALRIKHRAPTCQSCNKHTCPHRYSPAPSTA